MGDFIRHWWSLLYWNVRKTAFVLRRRRGTCPCQSPSDSGRAGVTRCEAAMTWDRPEHFRRVCPALRRGADGWMCGVDTAAVRPYWGRAFAWWGGAALAAYMLGAVGVAFVLLGRGYRDISPLDTLVPTRWERLKAARRDVFLRQAHAALSQRDIEGMWISLASASAAAPNDYEARLALAQIYSHLRMSSLATAEFRDLLERFPGNRNRTAVVFHDVLISVGQFDVLGKVALTQLAGAATAEKGAWLQALFLALRGARDPAQIIGAGREEHARLPDVWREAIRAEAAVRAGERGAAERWPNVPASKEHAALLVLGTETLAEHAPVHLAIDEIVRVSTVVGSFEAERLLFRLHARAGADRLALKSLDAMLALARLPAERERLLATLAEFPDADRVARLASALATGAPFGREELGSAWVAATLAGNRTIADLVERRLQQQYAFAVPADTPRQFSPANAMVWVKVLPLTRETAGALALRVARGASRPDGSAG